MRYHCELTLQRANLFPYKAAVHYIMITQYGSSPALTATVVPQTGSSVFPTMSMTRIFPVQFTSISESQKKKIFSFPLSKT